ncbi:unnamed protein product [Caenorhabditis auriculariae]|uniref:G protein-coupled receptor n=1 Tax=Caenorhabditis auriculariae TaxID=2777116 RepID=A0A8S1H9I7_9PELO|nr:unnamed protein product [Caenorhabditis auriculariae]
MESFYGLDSNLFQKISLLIHLTVSAFAIYTNTRLYRFSRDNEHFPVNFKALKFFLVATVIIDFFHSIALIILLGTHMITWYTLGPCSVGLPATVSYALQSSTTICYSLNSFLHLGVCLERSAAILVKNSSNKGCGCWGRHFLRLAMALVGAAVGFFSQRNHVSNVDLCPEMLEEMLPENIAMVILGSSEITAFGVTISRTNPDPQRKTQLSENFEILKLLLPFSIFHLVLFLGMIIAVPNVDKFELYFNSQNDLRAFSSVIYLLPIYSFLAPVILLSTLKKAAALRTEKLNAVCRYDPNENEVYFNMYKQQW